MKGMSIRAIILAIVILVVGSIGTLKICTKVLLTAWELSIINGDISLYNEDHTKTDSDTYRAKQLFLERQENYYESEDSIVRIFSNSNILFKTIFIFMALIAFVAVPVTVFKFVLYAIRYIYWGTKNRKQHQ